MIAASGWDYTGSRIVSKSGVIQIQIYIFVLHAKMKAYPSWTNCILCDKFIMNFAFRFLLIYEGCISSAVCRSFRYAMNGNDYNHQWIQVCSTAKKISFLKSLTFIMKTVQNLYAIQNVLEIIFGVTKYWFHSYIKLFK